MDDTSIVALYFERNEAALEKTAEQYGTYCQSVARRFLSLDGDIEEAISDAYLSLWQTIPPKRPDSLRAYLARILRNICLRRIERENADKRSCEEILPFDELSEVISSKEEDLVDSLALKDALKAFLDELAARDRILFMKRYFYNESIDSLARYFGKKTVWVKIKLYRLRCDLKSRLQNDGVLPKEVL